MNYTFRRFWCSRIFIAFILIIIAAAVVGLRTTHAAAEFTYKTDVNYTVDSDGTTHVSENYEVTNNTSNQYLSSLALSTPTDEVKNLTVKYDDGGAIPNDVVKKSADGQGYKYDYKQVNISFDRKITGKGRVWSFAIAYDTTKLVENKGSAHTVFIPAISPTNSEDYTITLTVPGNFGQPHSSGAKPTFAGTDSGKTIYTIDRNDLKKQSLALVFGDSTIYKVNFNYPLKNTTNKTQTMTITLPPDTSSQKIYVNSLDPKPIQTRLDEDGNVLADYTVPAGGEITVKTDVEAVVKYLEYDLNASGKKSDIPVNLVTKYTKASRYWQSTGADIILKAKTATSGEGKVIDIVKALDKLVVDTLSYNNGKIKYNIRQGAEKALQNPNNAVCLEYSDLLIALLRSQGIPARMPIGYGYSGNLKPSSSVSDSLHSWVEVYVPGIGWMNVDPTWGEKFDNFGKSDLDHFAFAVWGQVDAAPVAVTLASADQNYQYEKATIEYLSDTPNASSAGQLSIKKWLLLPFLSFSQFSVIAPSNVAGDNYFINLTNGHNIQRHDLGSLAPGQKVTGWVPYVGHYFNAELTAAFEQGTDQPASLMTVDAKVSYLPIIGLGLLIAGIFMLLLVKWLLKRRSKEHYIKKEEVADEIATSEDLNFDSATSREFKKKELDSISVRSRISQKKWSQNILFRHRLLTRMRSPISAML